MENTNKLLNTVPGKSDFAIKTLLKTTTGTIANAIIHPEMKSIFLKEGYLAGGCIRSLVVGEPINDYDIYFKTEKAANRFRKLFMDGLKGSLHWGPVAKVVDIKLNIPFTDKKVLCLKSDKWFTGITPTAITCDYDEGLLEQSPDVQFIFKYSGSPNYVVGRFDFTNCMAYYDIDTDDLVYLNNMKMHCHRNILVFSPNCFNCLSALWRMTKFQKRGWFISNEEMFKVAKRASMATEEEKKIFFYGKSSYSGSETY